MKTLQLAKAFVTSMIIYCFQRKTPKYKYWVLKVLCLETQMMILAGSKMIFSVCICQNFVMLVDAMEWDLTYKKLMKKIV